MSSGFMPDEQEVFDVGRGVVFEALFADDRQPVCVMAK
ncbi:hypothetical protein ALQ37_102234 [Pseudomonas syringae pv. aptata]|uniref:Uncharacterized protein n=1 Tax=Pseudomonas syringae pv. aptata TaxID=83167 RepID=A0A0N8T9W3_PSEAP|nr:hypothetical protein ALO85_101546 [Pseudomonas syringae pv. aptata]RMO45709.1 hypothetical protein ALQ40_101523 [Pseudomonas syringae]RMO60224.1 hypothetical protein ALQ37_102234 [Pseudomonas syringae pv. aptata]